MSDIDLEDVKKVARGAAQEAVHAAAERAAEKAASKASMDREELRGVVSEAVKETLTQLGIQSDHPIEMQRDFQHLRQWRRAGEDLKSKGFVVLMTIFLTGLISMLLLGVKSWLGK